MSVPVVLAPAGDGDVDSAARRANERALKTRDRFHRGTARWVVLVVVSFGALLMTVPFILMLLNAFKSPADYSVNGPLSWPTEFYTKGLVTYWNEVNYPQKLWNSTVIAGSVAVMAVLISLFNAYAIGIGRVKVGCGSSRCSCSATCSRRRRWSTRCTSSPRRPGCTTPGSQ